MLRAVSDRLAEVCRGKGRAFRFGGEEIGLVLRNHSEQEALAVAERGRLAIEQTLVNGMIQVTASFGVATMPPVVGDASALIGAADHALYDAKSLGRNLVRLDGEPPPEQPGPHKSERREPESGRLTEEQKIDMRRRVLRNEKIECPHDGAPFDVIDVTNQQSIGKEFLITCPDCGLSDTLPGPSR